MPSSYSTKYQVTCLQGENESLFQENESLREDVINLTTENCRLKQYISRLEKKLARLQDAQIVYDEMLAHNDVDGGCSSLLQNALATQNLDCARIMIEAGSEIHARSSSFATALHVAARQNLKTICQSLIGEGVDLDCVDDVGKTPLHYASERNSIGAAKALVEAGADIDFQDAEGNTPLHAACQFGSYDVAKALVEGGCDKSMQNADGIDAYNCFLLRPEGDEEEYDNRMHELFT